MATTATGNTTNTIMAASNVNIVPTSTAGNSIMTVGTMTTTATAIGTTTVTSH